MHRLRFAKNSFARPGAAEALTLPKPAGKVHIGYLAAIVAKDIELHNP